MAIFKMSFIFHITSIGLAVQPFRGEWDYQKLMQEAGRSSAGMCPVKEIYAEALQG